ncbi:MAG: UbiD family decarboxylase [Candidatus Helarchaeota archaeon]
MNFREYIKTLNLIEINKEVNPKFEMAAVLKALEGQPVHFTQKNVVGNIYSTPQLLAKSIGLKSFNNWISAFIQSKPGKLIEKGKQSDMKSIKITELPVLTHYEHDAGPYITSGAVIAQREKRKNMSVHRVLIIDEKTLVMRIVKRHLYEIFMDAKEHDEDLPLSICIGIPPAAQISASTSLPAEYFELNFAAALNGGELLVYDGLPDSEIIIRGKLVHDKEINEGPFADISGKYDIVRKQPLFEIDSVKVKKNYIYHALLPAQNDHIYLMGLPKIPLIYQEIKNAGVDVRNVFLSPGGYGWLKGIISIKKKSEDDIRKVINGVLKAHKSIKYVIITDEDVDITDPIQVESAVTINAQYGKNNPIIMENVRGSSLDPRAKDDIGSKMIIDATKPLRHDKLHFEKGKIPISEKRLKELLS